MWVTSEPLSGKEAEEAMRRAVPDFDHYLKRGQIEIVPYHEWYLKDGVFNLQRVLNAWVNKLEQALANGYDGLRLTGNTFWLEKRDWKNFADYEEEVNSVIDKYPMMAVCTYSINKCSASEVIDVVRNHQFALIKRGVEWELIESSKIKRAKEALRESEEKYRKLVENSKDSIVVIDLNGNVQFANKATEELTGFTSEDGIRMNVRKITPLKYWPKSLAMLLKARKGEQIPYFESMIRRKDGKLVPVESGGQAIFKDGKAVGIQIITRDITERKKAEDALRKSENESRTLLENLPQKIFFKDKNSVYVSCNENYARDLKIKSDEIAGKTDYDFYPKRLAEKYRADDKRIMESGKTEDIEEEYIQDGQKVFVHTVKTPVKDENGNVVGVLGIFWDITERKKAEQALRASLERYRSFIEVTGELGWTTNADGEVLEDIPSFRNFTGQTYEEVKGWGWSKALHPDDLERTTRIWKEANITKSKYEIEYRLRSHDGVYRYFMARRPCA